MFGQHGHKRHGVVAMLIGLFLIQGGTTRAQLSSEATSSAKPPEKQIEVTGCVSHNFRDKPPVIAALMKGGEQKGYWLVGNTASLQNAFFTPAHIIGFEIAPPTSPIAGPAGPSNNGTINVVDAKVFRPTAVMDPSYRDPSKWQETANATYGVRFAVPVELSGVKVMPQRSFLTQPSFPRQDGTDTFFQATFPNLYPHSDSTGISLSVSVNTKLGNRESCEQFGVERAVGSPQTLNGIRCVSVGGGGVEGSYRHIHTFQNGLCYDFTFFFGHARRWPSEVGCLIPVTNDNGLVRDIISRVRFFPPNISRPIQAETPAAPEVSSFTVNPGESGATTEFSWTTKGVDYVRLSFECSELVLIFAERQRPASCGARLDNQPRATGNLSPNSSIKLGLTAFQKYDLGTVPVTVTLTPFSHRRALSQLAKSQTGDAHPFNPIPLGVREARQNIELTLSQADRGASYAFGSSLVIKWKEPGPTRDSCVNLWLLRDGVNGVKNFVLNVGRRCLSPAREGEFAWTIPRRRELSGSGFRIYAAGNTSSAFSDPFTIAP